MFKVTQADMKHVAFPKVDMLLRKGSKVLGQREGFRAGGGGQAPFWHKIFILTTKPQH